MAEQVTVKITADADGAIQSVTAAGDAFEELQDAQDEATDSAEQQAEAQRDAATAAEQSAEAQQDLASASERSAEGQKDTATAAEQAAEAQRDAAQAADRQADAQRELSTSGGQANEVLFQTGDAIQDAQFGFAGAANNIAQVAENFAGMAQQAGGARGALSSIFSALKGPAGAIVALQGLMLVLPKVIEAFSDAEENSAGFTESLKEQSDILSTIGGDLETFREDVKALETTVAQFDTFFGLTGGLGPAVDAIVSGRGSKSLRTLAQLLEANSEGAQIFRQVLREAGVQVDDLATDDLQELREQIRGSKQAFYDAAATIDEEDAADILVRSPSSLADEIESRLGQVKKQQRTMVASDFFDVTEGEALEAQIDFVTSAMEKVVSAGVMTTDSAFDQLRSRLSLLRSRLAEIQQEEGPTEGEIRRRGIQEVDIGAPEMAEGVDPAPMADMGDSLDMSILTADLEQFNGSLRDTSEEMINLGGAASDAMAEGISQAITTAVEGGNVLQAVGQVLGSFLQTIGKAIVAYGVAMDSFKKALSNPFTAIAAGAALIAAGALVKNLASSGPGGGGGGGGGDTQPSQGQQQEDPAGGGVGGVSIEGRAEGGPVQGRTPYLVGEEGPELFVPGRTGRIVPNALGQASRRRGMRVQQQTDVSVDVTEPNLFDLTAKINESQRVLDRVARQ